PADLQVKLARALAQNQAGAKRLLVAVEKGKAPAGLLLDIHIRDRFPKERVEALTKNIVKPSAEAERLIADRVAEYREKGGDAEQGKIVYATNCAACHKLSGVGGDIGPQLEGIGNRGVERLVEDIIDPNRNIDVAFHYTIVQLKDGRLITGLKRREFNQAVVFATVDGKEITVRKAEIERETKAPASIMPTGFGQIIPATAFCNLLEHLLTH
ncbi:MAG: c-type cytochrome, partial [Verrucomicrobiota bacterium]|nr:c-type cytochrome [Verrucomicrobiota bacterium]